MSGVYVTAALEGKNDVPIVQQLVAHIGFEVGPVHLTSGKGRLDAQLPGYNNAARFAPWLVLRDLNGDAGCAPELVQRLLPAPATHMRFRVSVHAGEAWLLADREAISRFLAVPVRAIPADPETIADPKAFLVNLARRSRHRAIREDMVPIPGTTARVGPGYSARLIEFASNHWRADIAAARSASLAGCVAALQTFDP